MKQKGTMLGVLLMSSLLMACSTPEEKKTADAVRVEKEIATGTSTALLGATYVGQVEAETQTAVSFPGGGTIQRVLVSEGQHVSKGQLLAVIDDTQHRNSLMAGEAAMAQAQDAYNRMKVLHDRQSLSEMDWVQVQTTLQQAQSNLQKFQKNVNDCQLFAPCSGVVGSRNVEPGMTVMGAQPVCTILDINKVKVKISVPEKEVMNISKQATVTVDALAGAQFQSIGFERGVTADALSRTYEVRYLINNKDGQLLPGMVCNVQTSPTTQAQSQELITLPITSVQRGADGQMFVWTVKNGEAHRTLVQTGKAYGNRISITSGIHQGDEVVTKGYQKLNESCKVQ